ncbi:MAG TPA: NADH-ubiquinone oxidoreductase-F iron-sulfur binding region domain-containing protein [Acidobacteriota bacterium]|nr:NADH-ubiquinone oxidoreductase-F iron-sulfur binding region domain-containing protein [Acidobacteriota bacterium]
MSHQWAPFLDKLHRRQDQAGHLSRQAVEEVASGCGIAVAEAWGAVRFYHYFKTQPGDDRTERCQGPVCGLLKGHEAGDGMTACPGLCDQGPARRRGSVFQARAGRAVFSPPLVPIRGAVFPPALSSDGESLQAYLSAGGYLSLQRLNQGRLSGYEALQTLQESGLRGMGGAGFPAAVKWKAVREESSIPKYVVCNADEGEPGTFKDRAILHLTPHRLIEGMALCGHLVESTRGIIYLRYEYPEAAAILTRAIEEADQAGFLDGFQIEIRRGAGSYVCGEETAMLNSLEGRMPWPREKPPFPTQSGLFGCPTVINNVETLAAVPAILREGAQWFRDLGRGAACGSKLYSVSGCVKRPGNFELPLGISARRLIDEYAGGALSGPVKAFTLGGISGGLLGPQHLDMPLDFEHPQKEGFFLGSGGVVVLDQSACPVDFVHRCLLFYQQESCGRCVPCRIGTVRLRETVETLTRGGGASPADLSQALAPLLDTMKVTSACGMGRSVPLVMRGLTEYCAQEVEEHQNGHCRNQVCFRTGPGVEAAHD